MVQGPSDAVYYASFPGQLDLSLSCAINSGLASCAGEIDEYGMTITTSLQESAKPYLVQGGGDGGGSGSVLPTPTPPPPGGSGSNSSTEKTDGSSALRAGMCVGWVLVGSVVVGVVVPFLI